MLKNGKPIGVRDIQRELNLSSPSVARYHLSKLENAGLVKRQNGNYIVSKIFLENTVKIHHVVIPRFLFYAVLALLFYAVLALVLLITELTLLRSTVVNWTVYCFTIVAFVLFVLIFCAETVRVWLKGNL